MNRLHALMLASVLAVSGAAAAGQGDGGPIVALGFDRSSQTLIKADPKALYRSSDGGRKWIATALPPAAKGHLAAMAVASKGKGAVYVAGPGVGVLRSDDGGRSWVPAGCALPRKTEPRQE
jgi:photosystem II stability/assembly factor-like uncharacterized protein